jgi:hypothetical protein
MKQKKKEKKISRKGAGARYSLQRHIPRNLFHPSRPLLLLSTLPTMPPL